MARFEKFILIIFKNEGFDKVTDDKSDAGGLTKWGISQRAFPNLDIKSLTLEQAKQIYKKNYYDKCKIGAIKNELLALHIFDMAVNAGVSRASRMLQKIAIVNQDGIIGNKTIARVNGYNYSDIYIKARKDYYHEISSNGNNIRFLMGWLNRVDNTTKSL